MTVTNSSVKRWVKTLANRRLNMIRSRKMSTLVAAVSTKASGWANTPVNPRLVGYTTPPIPNMIPDIPITGQNQPHRVGVENRYKANNMESSIDEDCVAPLYRKYEMPKDVYFWAL